VPVSGSAPKKRLQDGLRVALGDLWGYDTSVLVGKPPIGIELNGPASGRSRRNRGATTPPKGFFAGRRLFLVAGA
jgi:hypothetical protein